MHREAAKIIETNQKLHLSRFTFHMNIGSLKLNVSESTKAQLLHCALQV